MTPLRPINLPAPQVGAAGQGGRADPAAARKAFFEIALGKTPTQAAATPALYAQPVQRIPDPAAEPPRKILPPGSLLDIKV